MKTDYISGLFLFSKEQNRLRINSLAKKEKKKPLTYRKHLCEWRDAGSKHKRKLATFSPAFLCLQLFSGPWSTFATKPHLTLDSPDFFFYLKEEDCRVQSEEFQRTPEFASNRNMGRTKLEA